MHEDKKPFRIDTQTGIYVPVAHNKGKPVSNTKRTPVQANLTEDQINWLNEIPGDLSMSQRLSHAVNIAMQHFADPQLPPEPSSGIDPSVIQGFSNALSLLAERIEFVADLQDKYQTDARDAYEQVVGRLDKVEQAPTDQDPTDLVKRIEALELIPPPIPVPDTEPKKGDEDEFRKRFMSLSKRLSTLEQFTHMTLGSALGRVEKALKTNPSFEPPAQYT